ncbi:MAG: putative Fe-S cluster assembly protein SufT [Gammaproteobacteria bacterium]|nr:putative Fe-S cluster assembly protein SufT [Gammaproteobacteria bacterium]
MSSPTNEPLTVNRDCEAILIPDGTAIEVPEGSVVFITQALGGNYTINLNGNLAQIGAKDADALGYDIPQEALIQEPAILPDGSFNEDLVWAQMRTCYDPEIPINVVELGLIYDCKISKLDDEQHRVDILMTLTAPGCGMGEFLAADVSSKVATIPTVTQVDVELAFDPPWSMEMMSEAARLEAGLF